MRLTTTRFVPKLLSANVGHTFAAAATSAATTAATATATTAAPATTATRRTPPANKKVKPRNNPS